MIDMLKSTLSQILFMICITTSCIAQKKIADIKSNSIISAGNKNYIVKTMSGGIRIENQSNRFINLKQTSPNLPNHIVLENYYKKIDVNQLTAICAKIISLSELEKMANVKNAGLQIDIKSNLKGDPIDVLFFTEENSSLTIKQLAEIETLIKESVKIYIRLDAKPYIEGSNFLSTNVTIWFTDMLKAKIK